MNTPHIAIIIGSARQHSRTAHAARYVEKLLRENYGANVDVLNPRDLLMQFPGQEVADDFAFEITDRIKAADAVLLTTPEYHGSYSSVIKTFIDNMGYPSALTGKPVFLLGVASGQSGAVKALSHLAGVCEHIGAVLQSDNVSLPRIHALFCETGECIDALTCSRLNQLANSLINIAQESTTIDFSI